MNVTSMIKKKKKKQQPWIVECILECDSGRKAEYNMEVLNDRSAININIKCVILMYMSDNWILNYPSIKNRIYSARSLVTEIIIRKNSVGLTHNFKTHAYIYIGNIQSFHFSPPDFSIKLFNKFVKYKTKFILTSIWFQRIPVRPEFPTNEAFYKFSFLLVCLSVA